MNPSLTSFVSWPTKKNALMLDQVPASEDPEAGPFLITASKGVLWVERAFPGGFLRVATQHTAPEPLFLQLVEAIAVRGAESNWGNVVPATYAGMGQAVEHLNYYGMSDLECLYGKGFKPLKNIGIPTSLVSWLPDKWGVLLAKDRSYVGTLYDLSDGVVAGVLHNASRGVVVLK